MKKIVNPFIDFKGYNCIGCSPSNPYGLKMSFFEEGDEIISFWEPDDKFTGYDFILHGGIQATLMDEIASWVVFVKLETGGFTSRLNVSYKSSVFTNKGKITLRA
ncbi:MAG: PaaI family thioesterase, partial [bacterium]|nr:PaaI family thioesterase [bacterium]